MDEINIKTTIKNDIKTLFLNANTFTALIGGIFPLSLSAAAALVEGCIPTVIYAVAFGALMAAITSVGFYAALKENQKMLNIYSVLTGLMVALETLAVAVFVQSDEVEAYADKMLVALFCIFHIAVTLAAMVLAMYLAKQVPSFTTPITSNSGLAYCMKFVGYGVLILLVFGFVVKFVVVFEK